MPSLDVYQSTLFSMLETLTLATKAKVPIFVSIGTLRGRAVPAGTSC
jgi:hypothetical protein